jgi:hypothetical protein
VSAGEYSVWEDHPDLTYAAEPVQSASIAAFTSGIMTVLCAVETVRVARRRACIQYFTSTAVGGEVETGVHSIPIDLLAPDRGAARTLALRDGVCPHIARTGGSLLDAKSSRSHSSPRWQQPCPPCSRMIATPLLLLRVAHCRWNHQASEKQHGQDGESLRHARLLPSGRLTMLASAEMFTLL